VAGGRARDIVDAGLLPGPVACCERLGDVDAVSSAVEVLAAGRVVAALDNDAGETLDAQPPTTPTTSTEAVSQDAARLLAENIWSFAGTIPPSTTYGPSDRTCSHRV
jgi:hypothetical protein